MNVNKQQELIEELENKYRECFRNRSDEEKIKCFEELCEIFNFKKACIEAIKLKQRMQRKFINDFDFGM